MMAMFIHFLPTASDMKEIVELLKPKGHAFTDSALLYVEMKARGPPTFRLVCSPNGVQISLVSPS